MTLRKTLALSLLLACGLPLLVFWLWPHSRALEAELQRAHERHLVLAQAAAETLDVYQINVEAAFSSIVDGVRDGADLSFVAALLEAQSFSHFCIVDKASGRVLEAFSLTGRAFPEVLPADLFAELARRVTQSPPQLNEVWLGQKGGPQFLLVEDLGDRYVFASVNGSFLERIANSVSFGEKGHMAILDAQGRVIAHPNPAWVAVGKDMLAIPNIAALYERQTPEVLMFHSPALNEDVVAGAAPVGASDWRVLVPQPVSEVQATVVAGRKSASFVFSAGLVLSAIVAMGAAAMLSRPLQNLARAADDIARGAEGVVVPSPPRYVPFELRRLSTTFNEMARRMEETLARITTLARQDPATGLLNKRSFQEAAEGLFAGGATPDGWCLIHVDLDNLKRINDIYGHSVGDEAIRQVARGLKRIFPAPALVARVGGDEFLVLAEYQSTEDLNERLEPIYQGQSIEVEASGHVTTKTACSVGVACGHNASDLTVLADQADEAMYFAKKRGLGFKLYDADMRRRTRRRLELSSQLRLDVASERIETEFQPIFCVHTGQIVAFEALARWGTAKLGPVPPSDFLPVARDVGIVRELDRCVRRKAFAFTRRLKDLGSAVPVAVNVTAPDLARADFATRFVEEMQEAGLRGKDVIVEVTEMIFHDRYGLAIDTLKTLGDLNVAVHLDDFGKGFSSHGLLSLYNFSAVKVDMRFAGNPVEDHKAAAIVGSLVNLGSQLGLSVVLEGIQSKADRAFVLSQRVDRVQGFSYAMPMGPHEALDFAAHPPEVRAACVSSQVFS